MIAVSAALTRMKRRSRPTSAIPIGASSNATRKRSSAARSDCAERALSVMSRAIEEIAMIAPWASRIALTVSDTVSTVPSFVRRVVS